MNKRIEELANQAGYYQEQDVDGSRFDAMPRKRFEKFAELVIRECIQVLDTSGLSGTAHTNTKHYLTAAQGLIKGHFGVKDA